MTTHEPAALSSKGADLADILLQIALMKRLLSLGVISRRDIDLVFDDARHMTKDQALQLLGVDSDVCERGNDILTLTHAGRVEQIERDAKE